jgi:hypothetical protein
LRGQSRVWENTSDSQYEQNQTFLKHPVLYIFTDIMSVEINLTRVLNMGE